RYEITALRADGTEFPVELSVAPIRVEGQFRLTGFLRDITERRRAEQALRDSTERYRQLFDSNPNPIWVYDVQTPAFLQVNQAAVRRYGYTRAEFGTLTLRDVWPAEEVPRLLERVARLTLGGQSTWAGRHRTRDGTLIDVELIAHVLTFDGRTA